MKPVVDLEKCDGCGLCIAVCKRHILEMVGSEIAIVDENGCNWCAQCEAVCVSGAIICPFEIVLRS